MADMFTIAKAGERVAAAVLPEGYRKRAEGIGDGYLIFDGGDVLPSPIEVSKVKGGGFVAKSHSKLLSKLISKGNPKPKAQTEKPHGGKVP